MARLTVISGPLAGRHFDITGDHVIGREDADIVLDDEEVSRRHAIVRLVSSGVIEVEDLGSRNGTWRDGDRITDPIQIRSNAQLRLGTTTVLVAVAEDDAQATRLSPAEEEGRTAVSPPSAPSAEAALRARGRKEGTPRISPEVAGAPFGAFGDTGDSRRRHVASRLWVPVVVTFTTIAATAAALIIYFAER